MSSHRLQDHQRPDPLEAALRYFHDLLEPLELREVRDVAPCVEPILYVMGCARSGSTLVYQYMSYSGLLNYPTNFLSRFYYAPLLGARLQQMLFDFDFRGEIHHAASEERFRSGLGKTQGPLAPHEFWYFWRRFFHFEETQKLTKEAIQDADADLFIRELRAFQSVVGKPLILKGMILNWDIPLLAKIDPGAYFLFIERRLEAHAESLVRARREFFGDESQWYSFKPPGYADVLELDPYRQAVWQVVQTNAAVDEGLQCVAPERVFRISYEAFCSNPRAVLEDICQRWTMPMPELASELPRDFPASDRSRETSTDWDAVVRDVTDLIARNGS